MRAHVLQANRVHIRHSKTLSFINIVIFMLGKCVNGGNKCWEMCIDASENIYCVESSAVKVNALITP